MATQNTLDGLLVDEDSMNEELLAETIAPYAGIGNNSGDFVPNPQFTELSSDAQVAVVLLYRKAAHELDFSVEVSATPKEITETSGVNHNTVKGAVRRLDDQGLVSNSDGEYHIPTYNYEAVKELIREDGN